MEILFDQFKKLGRYGIFLYILNIVPGILQGGETLLWTFNGYTPKARCCVKQIDGNNCSTANYDDWQNYKNIFPSDSDLCNYCDWLYDNSTSSCTHSAANATCSNASELIYANDNYFPQSIAKTHNLVCTKEWQKQLTWSMYTIGVGIGATLFSSISDRYGRRKTFLFCAAMFILVSNLTMISDNYYFYIMFQTLIGIFCYGSMLTAYIIFMEFASDHWRTVLGIWLQAFFTIGEIWDALLGYFIRDSWRWLQFLVGAPGFLMIGYYWWLPESPRWLIANNRMAEARKELEKAAKLNMITISEEIWQEGLKPPEKVKKASIIDLFSHWRLAKNTLCVFYLWFAASMSYYGVAQNTSSMPGNFFLSYTLLCFAELPGYLACIPMMEYWGRRPALIIMYGVGGVACVACGVLNAIQLDNGSNVLVYVTLAFALIGKMFLSAAFAIIYNYSAEVFPTVARQSGTGFASFFARVGSLSAPQIELLAMSVTEYLPFVIYGSVSVIAALLCFTLPETLNKALPETIEDAIYFGTKYERTEVREKNGKQINRITSDKDVINVKF